MSTEPNDLVENQVAHRPHYIYALRDPQTTRIHYVGMSTKPRKRLTHHKWDTTEHNKARRAWIRELLSLGLHPSMEILEECDLHTWRHRERYWIGFLKDQGEPLVNIRAGGDTSSWQPEEERAWRRRQATGRKLSGESRQKISEHLIGHEVTSETRAKLRAANAEQFADAEARQKHAVAMRKWSAQLPREKRHLMLANLNAGRSGKFADNRKMQEGRRRWLAEHPEEKAKLTEHFRGRTQWTGKTAQERSDMAKSRARSETRSQSMLRFREQQFIRSVAWG